MFGRRGSTGAVPAVESHWPIEALMVRGSRRRAPKILLTPPLSIAVEASAYSRASRWLRHLRTVAGGRSGNAQARRRSWWNNFLQSSISAVTLCLASPAAQVRGGAQETSDRLAASFERKRVLFMTNIDYSLH